MGADISMVSFRTRSHLWVFILYFSFCTSNDRNLDEFVELIGIHVVVNDKYL
jgi:hypothetical protein